MDLKDSPEESKEHKKGKLKVFLGAAPGVGKSFNMLEEAHAMKKENIDVVVGYIETHGRKQTEALLAGLEIVPRKNIDYRDINFEEFDIDAVLERKPQLVLIDELAHTNIEGSRHAKRHLDIEEILNAGIDVYSTLNIQHLESLKDIIEEMIHIQVRETVPDNILNNADEVVLVDLPPKELQKRLKEGKIYKADKTEAALNNFFTEGNLTALREMALRYTAERVDRQMTGFMHAHGIKGPLSNRERMMVCIDDDINSEELIRHASRIAKRNKISLLCVYVDNGNIGPLSNNQLQRSLKLAEQVGGEAITLTGADIADEIISFAKSRDINHILVGKAKSKWHSILNNSIADQLLKKSDDIEITIIPLEEIQAKKTSHNITAPKFRYIDFVYSSSMVIVASILAYALSSEFSSHNLSLIFLSASVFTAILFSSIYGIYSVIIGFSIFNHLFVSSKIGYFALRSEEMIKFGFYMLIVFITSHLASKIKNQVHMVKQQAEHLTLLYEFTKKVAEATNSISVYKAIVENAIAIAGDDAVILMPSDEAKLEVIIGPTDLGEVAYAAANWCFNNNEPAGYSSDTLSACKWAFLPMNTDIGTIGILGIYFDKTDNSLLFSQQRMLNLLVDQAAIAVERESLSNKNNVEDSMPTLFSSIALEAQEPINLLIEKINQLKKDKIHIGNDIRLELLDKIRREAENLNVMINAIINQNEENS